MPVVIMLLASCLLLGLLILLTQERRKAILDRIDGQIEIAVHSRQLAQLSRMAVLCDLSGTIAHEINQPLTAILGNAEAAVRLLTRDSIDVEGLRETLRDILTSNRHALNVVQRLRSLLRNDDSQHVPIDLNEAVASALTLARSDLVRQRVRCETQLEPGLRHACGDRVQIEQVILNLILNACEAMAGQPEDRRRISITTRSASREPEVELIVSDCGAGIKPQLLDTIFQPFVTTKGNGLGLGLSICRSIIETHGGRIWAESGPPGATFHVTLPAKR